MPLLAQEMKTLRAEPRPEALAACAAPSRSVATGRASALRAFCPRLCDHRVECGRRRLMRGHLVGDELSVDDERRDRLDLVGSRCGTGAVDLALDRERVVHVLDLLPVESLTRRPLEECLVLPQAQVLAVQRRKDFGGEALLLAERLERVVDLCQGNPALLEHDRYAAKLNVGRHRLHPVLQDGLEICAMRTSVREK